MGYVHEDVVDKFGIHSQLDIAAEECIELTHAIFKLKRAYKPNQIINNMGERDKIIFNMIDEIADVEIMLMQLMYIIDQIVPTEKGALRMVIDRYKFKLNRLKERLEDDL